MRLRRREVAGVPVCEAYTPQGWRRLTDAPEVTRLLANRGFAPADDLLPYLQLGRGGWCQLAAIAPELAPASLGPSTPLLPVRPRSFRDFMLFEKHAIDAARGFARHFFAGLYPVARAYEALTRRPFPKFRPHPLWYRQPTYYFGNHNTFVTDGEDVLWPPYSTFFDYEVEVGAILAHPLHNATADEAAMAIGGFVVLNDFSARDVQLDEMRSGFGPQKAKHFCSSMSAEVITADEVSSRLQSLEGSVSINDTTVARVSSHGPQFSLEEAIAFTSRSERLIPGELFGSGTLPGGSGIENGFPVALGDRLTLRIEGVGRLSNTITKAGSACT